MSSSMEDICLKHDNGEAMRFHGRLYSESSHFDEESGCLTRQQLYTADNGDQVYYIVRSSGHDRSRHAYRLKVNDGICMINNGKSEISMNIDLLLLAVRSLCGLEEDGGPSMALVEEMLKAANA